jgi:hypothetical protein
MTLRACFLDKEISEVEMLHLSRRHRQTTSIACSPLQPAAQPFVMRPASIHSRYIMTSSLQCVHRLQAVATPISARGRCRVCVGLEWRTAVWHHWADLTPARCSLASACILSRYIHRRTLVVLIHSEAHGWGTFPVPSTCSTSCRMRTQPQHFGGGHQSLLSVLAEHPATT